MKRGLLGVVAGAFLSTGFLSLANTEQRSPSSASRSTTFVKAARPNYLKFADETEAMLRRDVLGVWFPRTVDSDHGGFRSNFARDWRPTTSQGKFSVFEGRMTWVAGQVAVRRPELRDQFLPMARHGVKYLSNVLWDRQDGGFFWGLEDDGKISSYYTDGKHLYGLSFALYGAAGAEQATGDPQALELAQRAFRWMDDHAHDTSNGGYFEWLTRDGKPIQAHPETGKVEFLPVALSHRLQVNEYAHPLAGGIHTALRGLERRHLA